MPIVDAAAAGAGTGQTEPASVRALGEICVLLTRHRQLTIEMARREITERYSGQLFGVFWAVGHPLILILVYVYIFSVVFQVKIGGTPGMPLDYTTYLLAGLIPWLGFQESMSKAATVVVNNANLVKQVVFPLEVLPAKGVLATLVTEAVFLALLTAYIVIRHHILPTIYVMLPVLIVFQTMAMMGVSYALAAIGVYLRDTKDFVQIFLVVGVYLVPAFYLPSFVPLQFRVILYLNPFSYMIWCFQDVLYFGRFAHPWAWPAFAAGGVGMLVLGFAVFTRLRTMFGNVL
jgi:lipopolysaccharide transport system permease protein